MPPEMRVVLPSSPQLVGDQFWLGIMAFGLQKQNPNKRSEIATAMVVAYTGPETLASFEIQLYYRSGLAEVLRAGRVVGSAEEVAAPPW